MCLGSASHGCGTVWPLVELGTGQDDSIVLALLQGNCSVQLGRREISPNDELHALVSPQVSLLTWPLGSGGLWSKSRLKDVQIRERLPMGEK